ncbi:hypothetical protein K491DRAFT_688634 [Lophiostoma macrostomum CBS 122681]|uniref:Uncharacterized protein n=1 Tax=Lophiostoma macrostomum CBS 122681 TaxID=1314788 RepID=A0A6A6TJ18_9PLEO|nr:hypothetical protein K491DRAFT_688634 [Lophiostoma macrostomum CBS 122681]
MESTAQEPYRDSPPSTRPSTPSPSTSTKPLPSTPPVPQSTTSSIPDKLQAYLDSPSAPQLQQDTRRWGVAYPSRRGSHSARWTITALAPAQDATRAAYTDAEDPAFTLTPTNSTSEGDVPLAYLYTSPSTGQPPANVYPVPHAADTPPSYTAAVRDAFRVTLIQHVSPSVSELEGRRSGGGDEEALLDGDGDGDRSERPAPASYVCGKLFLGIFLTVFCTLFLAIFAGCVFGMVQFYREIRRHPERFW